VGWLQGRRWAGRLVQRLRACPPRRPSITWLLLPFISCLQGLGRSAEERLRSERLRAMERLDQKRQLLEVG